MRVRVQVIARPRCHKDQTSQRSASLERVVDRSSGRMRVRYVLGLSKFRPCCGRCRGGRRRASTPRVATATRNSHDVTVRRNPRSGTRGFRTGLGSIVVALAPTIDPNPVREAGIELEGGVSHGGFDTRCSWPQ